MTGVRESRRCDGVGQLPVSFTVSRVGAAGSGPEPGAVDYPPYLQSAGAEDGVLDWAPDYRKLFAIEVQAEQGRTVAG
jgi:hypothetical protein